MFFDEDQQRKIQRAAERVVDGMDWRDVEKLALAGEAKAFLFFGFMRSAACSRWVNERSDEPGRRDNLPLIDRLP